MSPQSLKQRLTLPERDRSNKFSIWTCGTTRAEPGYDAEVDGFYTSKTSQDRMYSSNRVKASRSMSRYHYTRADEWEASKNLRHLLSKNVNFLSPGSVSESPFNHSHV